VSARTMHRWKQRYERQGDDGLFDRRTRRPSPRRVPLPLVQQVLQLHREHYCACNVRHFHERLQEAHGIHLSYTWVKTCLQTTGLISRRRRHGPHRLRRPRRPLPGMLLQLDGNEHGWMPGLPGRQTVLAIIDDATNVVYAAALVPEETTRAVLTLLRVVVEQQGVFCSLYTDRASLFVTTRHGQAPHQPQRA
jgi:transposase